MVLETKLTAVDEVATAVAVIDFDSEYPRWMRSQPVRNGPTSRG